MNYKFFPHTEKDIQEMLDTIGVKSLDELFSDIPEHVRLRKDYDLPESKSELEIRKHFEDLSKKNEVLTVFAGGGVYDHYTPSVVPSIVSRSEYLTSYTPYQAEISQGTLHYIFEFQSMMTALTGMDISNASMYDSSTATAEAMLMAIGNSKKANTLLISDTVNPRIINVVKTYAYFQGIDIVVVPSENGVTSKEALKELFAKGGVAGFVAQQPNKFGVVEDMTGVADLCHENKALFVMNCNALSLALLKTPKEWGADIAVGDVQTMGLPMSFGGPYAGYMCCTEKLMRKIPGRIVGKTIDENGQRVFALTLQAREQHIRRQKATSNICSNQSLMALFATIYMSVMGKEGVREAAQMSMDGAHYLCDELLKTGKFTLTYQAPFFNEFCVTYQGDVDALQKRLLENGFLGGIKVDNDKILFAVTEKRTKEEIDQLVSLTL